MLIAQLSDLHIRPAGQRYKGVVDSSRMLADAIDHLHALDRQPDLLLITGDLVDEGRAEEYAELQSLLGRLAMPYLLVPGNHDERQALRTAFGPHQPWWPAEGPLHCCVDEHPVRIVALDSCVPGQHHGQVDAAGLEWLRHTLASYATRHKPTLVLLHHPPFASGLPYMDAYRLLDAEPLAAVISRFPQVEAVLCGHVHRVMFRRWAGTVVAACPSPATQIALRLQPDAEPASYLGPSACLLHLWNPTHGLVSHVSHIGTSTGAYPGPYPFY